MSLRSVSAAPRYALAIGVAGRQHGRNLVDQRVDAKRIKPVVDRVPGFDEAPQAYAYLQSGQHFGKVVIRVAQ